MYKNKLLILTYILGLVPKTFEGYTKRLNLSLFHSKDSRIDFFFMYYTWSINFLILAYCVRFNKDIDKRISNFILIICSLDIFHLIVYARQGFGYSKIVLSLLILLYLYRKEAVNYIKYLYRLWI